MISILVSNRKQNQRFQHSGGPLEFGRGPRRDSERFVLNDVFASRDQLRVEELPDKRLRVENLSIKQELLLGEDRCLAPGGHEDFSLPLRLKAGQTLFEFEWVPVDAFDRASLLTIDAPAEVGGPLPTLDDLGEAPVPRQLIQWLEAAVARQRQATSSIEFYAATAALLVDMVGLDLGMVLLRRDWTWEVAARHAADPASSAQFSPALLSHVIAEGRTFYQDMTKAAPPARGLGLGLQGVDAVVVAPIFGLRENMVGALYGLRNPRFPARGGLITPLEAEVVQLLAGTVGGHLGRDQAVRTRLVHEQSFALRIVREIERDPTLLEGRSQEITLLVSSLDDFAALVEQLGPQNAFRLARELLERQTEKVIQAGGVVLTAADAGLTALWNAPVRQHDHAMVASGAALAFLGELPELNGRWQAQLGAPLSFNFGLHTGPAQVGSIGGPQHFRYGATGPAVRLAVHVRRLARRLRLPLVVTGSTAEELPETFALRRLGRARLAGEPIPVVLYEVHGPSAAPEWLDRRDTYEKALGLFESGKWAEACNVLLPLTTNESAPDMATLRLMRQAWQCREAAPASFEGVLDIG
jgi:adenylate cyclase